MILLSAHLDRVIQDFDLKYEHGTHIGLLDNIAGVLLTYLLLYDEPMLVNFERQGALKVYHNKAEEWGRLLLPPMVTKKDVVVCVDVWCMDAKYDFSLDNIWGFRPNEVRGIREHLELEGFRPMLRKFRNVEDEHDESWEWHRNAGRALTFSIPILAKNNGWHRIQQDNAVTVDRMARCRAGLKSLIRGPLAGYLEAQ
jgi:hypothetical protein